MEVHQNQLFINQQGLNISVFESYALDSDEFVFDEPNKRVFVSEKRGHIYKLIFGLQGTFNEKLDSCIEFAESKILNWIKKQ